MTTNDTLPPRRAVDRIRDSARELFYRRGIRAVGVDVIVAKAGVTKPSLYRSFASKDDLATDYLDAYARTFLESFDWAVAIHHGDPRSQIRAWIANLGSRATRPGYRGCGLSNAAVEYPEVGHPARVAAERHKRDFRRRLSLLTEDMGVADPDALADGLMLLIEGAYVTGQLFGPGGPAVHLAAAADALIEAHLMRSAPARTVAKLTVDA